MALMLQYATAQTVSVGDISDDNCGDTDGTDDGNVILLVIAAVMSNRSRSQ
jgi:hypothetical protein